MGMVNGAIFRQADPQPTGTGVIDSFSACKPRTVRRRWNKLQHGCPPLQFDENSSPQFTRFTAFLSSIPKGHRRRRRVSRVLLDIKPRELLAAAFVDQLRL